VRSCGPALNGTARWFELASSPRERNCAHRWRSGLLAASRRMSNMAGSWFETAHRTAQECCRERASSP
jgi:hypothetical protein